MDRLTLDILHNKVRDAVIASPAVDQARNIGVLKPGQDLPFGAKPFHDVRVEPCAFDHFDGDCLPQFVVGALAAVDGAHASPAQEFRNS